MKALAFQALGTFSKLFATSCSRRRVAVTCRLDAPGPAGCQSRCLGSVVTSLPNSTSTDLSFCCTEKSAQPLKLESRGNSKSQSPGSNWKGLLPPFRKSSVNARIAWALNSLMRAFLLALFASCNLLKGSSAGNFVSAKPDQSLQSLFRSVASDAFHFPATKAFCAW